MITGAVMVGDKVGRRQIECSNPEWGTEELSELLLAHERSKVKRR
jgi:hypothetical protein